MSNPPESIFVHRDDLEELTGHGRPAIQMRWLRANTIPFIVGGDGRPKVARQTLMDKLDGVKADENQLPALCETMENWDKVTEELMAELMGLTPRALQGRRARGKIPPSVWQEVEGRIMYSMKRFDDWLEGQWAPTEQSAGTSQLRKPRKIGARQRKERTGPVKLLV